MAHIGIGKKKPITTSSGLSAGVPQDELLQSNPTPKTFGGGIDYSKGTYYGGGGAPNYSAGTTYGSAGAPSLGSPSSTVPNANGLSMETAAAMNPKTGVGSAVGSAIGLATGTGPVGMVVGGAIGAGVDTLINWLSESYAQDEYKKVAAENRAYAEKIYRETVAREEEQEQYRRGVAKEALGYARKQDKKAEAWAIKQDNYNKYLTQVSAFSNFLNSDGAVRQNLINNWQNQSKLQAA